VCDPRRNGLLKEGSKSDRIDARKLAVWPDASADLCAAGAERVALRLRLQNLGSREGRSSV
jgi:hypothetical protein